MAKADEIYANAISLAKAFDDNFVELAHNLRLLQESDPDRFRDFLQASSIGSRKAYYLINVDKTFTPLKVPKKKLIEIGWTKAMVIQPHATKQNVLDLIEFARTHTAAELKKYVKGEDTQDNSHAVLLYFSPEDYSKLMDALIENGATRSGRGLVDKEKALLALLDSKKN